MPATDFQKQIAYTLATGWRALGDSSSYLSGSFVLFLKRGRTPSDIDICFGIQDPHTLQPTVRDIKILDAAGYTVSRITDGAKRAAYLASKDGQNAKLEWMAELFPFASSLDQHPVFGSIDSAPNIAIRKMFLLLRWGARGKDLSDLLWMHNEGFSLSSAFDAAIQMQGKTHTQGLDILKGYIGSDKLGMANVEPLNDVLSILLNAPVRQARRIKSMSDEQNCG